MAKAPKPVDLMTKHLTKEELDTRKEQEKKLKGNNKKVYKKPKDVPEQVSKIYITITKELKQSDILNDLDIDLILTTADAIYRLRKARAQLDKYGEVIEQPDGKFVKSPWVQVIKDFKDIFFAGVRELGLSPSSRAKLALYAAQSNIEESDEEKLFG